MVGAAAAQTRSQGPCCVSARPFCPQLEEEGLDTEPPEDAGELPLEYQVDTLADDEARTADI